MGVIIQGVEIGVMWSFCFIVSRLWDGVKGAGWAKNKPISILSWSKLSGWQNYSSTHYSVKSEFGSQ